MQAAELLDQRPAVDGNDVPVGEAILQALPGDVVGRIGVYR